MIPSGTALPILGTICIQVTAVGDSRLEGTETFSISIMETDDASFVPGTVATTLITIADAQGNISIGCPFLKVWSSAVGC